MKLKMELGIIMLLDENGYLASEVKFASELNDERTLDEVIQRELKESRSKKQIVRYLQRNDKEIFLQ